MRAKNWNFYYKKENKYIIDWILEKAFLWIAIGFLWMSFFHIVKEGYPAFFSDETIAENILQAESQVLEQETAKSLKIGFWEVSNLQEGFLSLADVYIKDWNAYYGTNYFVMSATGNYRKETFWLISIVWWFVVVGNAYLLRKRIFYVFFPLSALIMQFLVGRSPQEDGIIYLFIGALMLLLTEQREQLSVLAEKYRTKHRIGIVFTRLFALLLSVSSLFFAGILFENQIAKLQEKKAYILEWQQNSELVSRIESFFQGFNFGFSAENLNNQTPQYTGKVILEMDATYKPEINLYLKGFYGTNYKNGTWNQDDSIFAKACKESGYKEEEIGAFISFMPFEIMEQSRETLKNHQTLLENHYVISYKNGMGNIAYVPYLFDYRTLDETYRFSGDYLVKKSLLDKSVSMDNYQRTSAIATSVQMEDISFLIENAYLIDEEDSFEKRKWYNEIAKQYKTVPQNMEFISEIAKQINADVEEVELDEYYTTYQVPKMHQNVMNENLKRANLAYKVAYYLENTMSYNLDLESFPVGKDPVQFAMTESYEGYCMHFASSATLLLRELGVPARYASGYVVRPTDFKQVNDGYHAQILDYHSHAWVEIYLDDVGWLPIEVTPGYDLNDTELPTKQNIAETQSEEMIETQMESELETELRTEETQEVQKEEIETELADSQMPEGTEWQNMDGQSTESTEFDGSTEVAESDEETESSMFSEIITEVKEFLARNSKIILTIIWLFSIFMLSMFSGKWLYAYYVKLLEEEIQKKQTKKAVKRINRRIYRYVWLCGVKNIGKISYGKLLKARISDKEYGFLLQELFTNVSKSDWEAYMEIMKKMYYSKTKITEEEMMHCYKCYRECLNFAKR